MVVRTQRRSPFELPLSTGGDRHDVFPVSRDRRSLVYWATMILPRSIEGGVRLTSKINLLKSLIQLLLKFLSLKF